MRQSQLVDGSADRLQHLARRHLEARRRGRRSMSIWPLLLLPELDAAGVDELDAVAARRLEPPCDRVAQPRRNGAAGLADQLEQHLVVAHQDQERLVDHRRVAQLGEHVTCGQWRRRGLDDRRVAQQRVAIAGRERRGHEPAGARTQDLGAVQGIVTAVVGRQPTRSVDLGPAMCAWMSTPPGITTIPRASIRRASGPTSATTLPSCEHRSRTSPSISLAGSWIAPPVIRIAVIAQAPPAGGRAAPQPSGRRRAPAPATSAGRRRAGEQCRCRRRPPRRCGSTPPPSHRPAGKRDLRYAVAELLAGALDAQRDIDSLADRE